MCKNILNTIIFIFVLLSQPLAAAETVWIDVRSAEEFTQGHLPNAINIPHTEISEKITTVTTDKKVHIQLYCRSGRRSALAEEQLNALGYENVSNAGGYEQLKNSMVPER